MCDVSPRVATTGQRQISAALVVVRDVRDAIGVDGDGIEEDIVDFEGIASGHSI